MNIINSFPDGGGGGNIDTELSPISTNAVQNKVITNIIPDKGFGDTWLAKTWSGLTNFRGSYIWTDGEDIYYSNNSNQYVLDKSTSTWTEKTWNGLTNFNGNNVWTDGDNIYYSNNSNQYVLDKSTSTWSTKTWKILTSFNGVYVWTDGDNIYFSNGTSQYVLDKSTSTWSTKTWSGLTNFNGILIWADGTDIYYSESANQYILDKSTSIWTEKTWNGLSTFSAQNIWTDGTDIYYSNSSDQYILDKSTSTWSTKIWSGLTSFNGSNVWTNETKIYYSYNLTQYTLSKQKGFGTSATKDFTESVTSGSKDLVTSGAVAGALSDYVEPNPQDTASTDLTKLKIGNDVFNVGGGTDISGKTDLTMIATVEAGATSSRAYAKGEEFIIGGILRRAKDAIAQGDTFTSSNMELAPSVTEQMSLNNMTQLLFTNSTGNITLPQPFSAFRFLYFELALANGTAYYNALVPSYLFTQLYHAVPLRLELSIGSTRNYIVIAYYDDNTIKIMERQGDYYLRCHGIK